ncbi:MAG: hypothetical protein AB1896_19395 [Thermodesulfobacteriota bacterium]
MLKEVAHVRQIEGESRRRWFNDEYFDLVVWLDDRGEISGFQLAYGRGRGERALTWRRGRGYRHDGVDDGEPGPWTRKMSPILVADGEFPRDEIAEAFERESARMDPEVAEFVRRKLREYSPGAATEAPWLPDVRRPEAVPPVSEPGGPGRKKLPVWALFPLVSLLVLLATAVVILTWWRWWASPTDDFVQSVQALPEAQDYYLRVL